jgi:hypothetical protein
MASSSSDDTRDGGVFDKRLRDAPFDFRYYSNGKLNVPEQEEIYKMLDDALFPNNQLVEKAPGLIRHPSTCGKKFEKGEHVYTCECGRDDKVLLCSDCFDPDQHQNCSFTMRRDGLLALY